MYPQLQLLPGAISEILASVNETGTLTLNDRYGLMAAILDENIEEEEARAITRLLRSIKRGRLSYEATAI
ncbi:hypothetical protein IQ249_16715 [Lusitaniella coriacea LEGE 07157]|uniref:Uncharacterized protein n=1 Tax=Lusitaniella coriacea LEGE 07157 TaxID=945747 RepID=A0A8J7IUF9_9CYAN|nr:hypothetical protein [Lusitaniella coriacea]MBE9117542.1 hypothetical protein [Lusitaniella coriacea LEGE 07157]